MLTKSHTIKHIEELPPGSLIYYSELGDGLLCVSASYDGQQGFSTMIVPLSGKSNNPYALQTLRVDRLSGRAVLVEGARAEVILASATSFDEAAAYVAPDGTYVRLRAERPMMIGRQCLRLDDGIIRSSPPTSAVGFAKWRIVMEDDTNDELWNSNILDSLEGKGVSHD